MNNMNEFYASILHNVREEAKKEERERIMKLLEGYANAECDEYCGYKCECFGKYEAQAFIALIKGENK